MKMEQYKPQVQCQPEDKLEDFHDEGLEKNKGFFATRDEIRSRLYLLSTAVLSYANFAFYKEMDSINNTAIELGKQTKFPPELMNLTLITGSLFALLTLYNTFKNKSK